MIDDGVRAGAFRNVNGPFAAQVVAVTIDAVQSGDLLRSTGLSAGDAFAELGDLLLDGLNRPDSSTRYRGLTSAGGCRVRAKAAVSWIKICTTRRSHGYAAPHGR